MSKLPRVSGRDCVKTLIRAGFQLKRQEGSHIILRRDEPFAQSLFPTIASLTWHAALDNSARRNEC